MNIYIIAGPPGIGKSSSGSRYTPKNIEVIDHDLAAYQYKKDHHIFSRRVFLSNNPLSISMLYFPSPTFVPSNASLSKFFL